MLVKSQERRVKSQNDAVALRAGFDTQHSTLSTQPSRLGVTLIELLVVMLIISILAALVLGVAAVAGETARQAQSKHIVERLHTLLTDFYDTYKTRRVKVRSPIEQGIINKYQKASDRGVYLAQARLHALREIMMMEVPDRWSDILLTDVPSPPTAVPLYPYFSDLKGMSSTGRTQLASVYLRRYADIATRINSITNLPNTAEEITDNQGAECLYMIITLACGDGEARSLFKEADIGDTDGDGAPEFLDGWGHAINFLRWAPGFESQIQIDANQFNSKSVTDDWKKAAAKDHDPFDIYRVDPPAFRLVPLIYSGGRDETFGIRLVKPHVVMYGITKAEVSSATAVDPVTWRIILPWASVNDLSAVPPESSTVFLGTANADGTASDNIHNHLLGLR